MAQDAIETETEPTDSTGIRCQKCGETIPGQPFYRMRDTSRNEAGEFGPTPNADAFCDVICQRQYDAAEGASDA